MLTGTTSTGFAWEIDPDALDDMELLDALAEIDAGKLEAISTACLHLLGKEQRARLYDHRRDDKGRVRFSDISAEVLEIIKGMPDGPKF